MNDREPETWKIALHYSGAAWLAAVFIGIAGREEAVGFPVLMLLLLPGLLAGWWPVGVSMLPLWHRLRKRTAVTMATAALSLLFVWAFMTVQERSWLGGVLLVGGFVLYLGPSYHLWALRRGLATVDTASDADLDQRPPNVLARAAVAISGRLAEGRRRDTLSE